MTAARTRTRSAAGSRPSRPRRRTPGRATGDRLLPLGLVVLVVLLAATALGPLERYAVAADRVDGLRAQRAELADEVARLEERRDALSDPEEIELLARREHGFVKPGELPFVVVTPEEELELGPAAADAEAADEAAPWYRRLGLQLEELFRGP